MAFGVIAAILIGAAIATVAGAVVGYAVESNPDVVIDAPGSDITSGGLGAYMPLIIMAIIGIIIFFLVRKGII